MTAAWREYQRATALINRVRDYGLIHPDATVDNVLTALHEEPAPTTNCMPVPACSWPCKHGNPRGRRSPAYEFRADQAPKMFTRYARHFENTWKLAKDWLSS